MPLHTAGLPLWPRSFFLQHLCAMHGFGGVLRGGQYFSGQQIRVDFPFALEYTGCSNRAVLYMAQVP